LKPVKFEQIFNEYRAWLAARGLAASTIARDECYLRQFLISLEKAGVDDLKEVSGSYIHRYFLYLCGEYRTPHGKPLARSAYRGKVYTVRKFFDWLVDTGRLLVSPVPEPPGPGLETKLPEPLSEQQTLALLEACPAHSLAGVRDRAILELLYSTGIRRLELVNLNVSDYAPERSELTIIRGKGAKDRLVPVGEYAAAYLGLYLQLVRPWQAAPDEPALFVSVHHGRRLCKYSLNSIVKKIAARSGIARRVSPHTLRHSMATHLLRNGADIRHVQAILGHASLESATVYTHLELADLKQTIKESHPHGIRPGPKTESKD
jgi:integrase/recombinase XerD